MRLTVSQNSTTFDSSMITLNEVNQQHPTILSYLIWIIMHILLYWNKILQEILATFTILMLKKLIIECISVFLH